MHVLQYVAYKLPDDAVTPTTLEEIEEAKQDAVDNLSSELSGEGFWFDWCVVGGGRWNDEAKDAYADGLTNKVLSYAENAEEFLTTVNEALAVRLQAFESLKVEALAIDLVGHLNSFDGSIIPSSDFYPVKQSIAIMQGRWNEDSAIYDWSNFTGDTKYMLQDLSKNGKRWLLVPVDFHS